MKSLYDILTQLQLDTSTDLPALLATAGLDDFEIYHIGQSKDAQQLGFFIYQNDIKIGYDTNSISIIFQLQLYQVDDLTASKYSDVIIDYFKKYDPNNLKMDYRNSLEYDYYPMETNSANFAFIVAEWQEEIDSCE